MIDSLVAAAMQASASLAISSPLLFKALLLAFTFYVEQSYAQVHQRSSRVPRAGSGGTRSTEWNPLDSLLGASDFGPQSTTEPLQMSYVSYTSSGNFGSQLPLGRQLPLDQLNPVNLTE